MYLTVMPFLIALLAGLLLTPLTARLALWVGLRDEPSADKLHARATPMLGGLSVLVAMFLAMWLLEPEALILLPLTAGMALVAVVGLWDDAQPVRPLLKLLGLLPPAIAAALLWPEPFPLPYLAVPVFILGFLLVSNAVNLLDTLDGLTGLMTAISAGAMGIMAATADLPGLSVAAFAMSGACVAFLFFNWRLILPAGIFLGDMGALALGAGLFVMATYLVLHAPNPAAGFAAVLPIGLVMTNAIHTITIRKRAGARALSRTKDHISERLYRAGVPRVEVTIWLGLATLISAGAGVAAWMSPSLPAAVIALIVGVVPIAYLCVHSLRLKLPPEGTPWHNERTICRIITRLDVGGPAQHCVYLCEMMEAKGWRSHLLHGSIDPNHEVSMEYLLDTAKVDAHRVPTLQREVKPLADLQAFWSLYRLIRSFRPQIVHTHHAKAGTMGRLAAALCGVPVIIHTYHGTSLKDYFGPVKSRIFLLLEQLCERVSTLLVSLGPNDREELIRLGVAPEEKFATIPLGLPLRRFADAAERRRGDLRRELGLANGELLVAYVGRLVPIKNVPAFVDMAAAVLKQRNDLRFVLFGEGPVRGELEQKIAEYGIGKQVSLKGVTQDVERVYADADLLVLCSRREGMPLVIMEALAAGVPVISTRVGDVTNSVIPGTTGRLVPPGDTDALTQAVMEALADREVSVRMARAGQEHVLSSFSVEALVDRIDALYTAILTQTDYVDPHPLPITAQHAEKTVV